MIELRILNDEQRQQVKIQNWVEKCHAQAEKDRRRIAAKRAAEMMVPRYPTIGQIKIAVCEHFGVELIDLVSERRDKLAARARHVAAYLCRKMTPFSFPKIAAQLGKRDHTTAIASYKRVLSLLDEGDDALRSAIEEIRGRVEEALS